jgi:hypothetical protein
MATVFKLIDLHTPRGSLNRVPYPKATTAKIRLDAAFNAREILGRAQRVVEGEVLIVGQQRPRTPTRNNLEQQQHLATKTVQYKTPINTRELQL